MEVEKMCGDEWLEDNFIEIEEDDEEEEEEEDELEEE